jgi:hypothetical protein
VLQCRPSANAPVDHWLMEHATPAYQHIFAGVPLLDVYDYADFERATAAVDEATEDSATAQ